MVHWSRTKSDMAKKIWREECGNRQCGNQKKMKKKQTLSLVGLGDYVMSVVAANMSLYDLLRLMGTCKQLTVSVTPLLRRKLWYMLNSINVEPLLARFDTLLCKMSTEFPLMMSPLYFQCRFLHTYIMMINARLIDSKVKVIAEQRPQWKLQIHILYNCCETLTVLSLLTLWQMRRINCGV